MFRRYLFPSELLELNWRLWSFVAVLAVGGWAVLNFPVGEIFGYVDPFYSPTILIIPIPTLFRLSCYAYRKDYYRHLFRHPLGCSNQERGERAERAYTGERNAVFQLWNLHRFFLYAGLVILPFFYYDVFHSLTYTGSFALRLGSLILLANTLIVTTWTLSCHALRHLIGGNLDCYSCVYGGKARKSLFDLQSWWNSHHEAIAWVSLLTFFFTDLYLRALQAGVPLDIRFI